MSDLPRPAPTPDDTLDKWNEVVVIGTYWSRGDNAFDFTPVTDSLSIYSFGDEIEVDADLSAEVTYADRHDRFGPLRFAIEYAKLHVSSMLIELFTNTKSELIELIDQRALGLNTIGTQPFFTGFFNYFENTDHVSNFVRLFTGSIDYNEVQEMGKAIYQSQIQMAAERAANNSKIVTLRNGLTALVTEAPELCNLSHGALHDLKSEHPVTITVKMGLKTDKMHYSVRTYDGTDARSIVEVIDGGGSDIAAGGTIDFTLPFPL